jgi:hypothetical protein
MKPKHIYEAVLGDVEMRKYWHAKHLSTYELFFEGIRRIKEKNGMYD